MFNEVENNVKDCLKDRRILYIGDSTLRYEYFTLAYFSEHGYWPLKGNLKGPNPLLQGDVAKSKLVSYPTGSSKCRNGRTDWERFFWYTNSLLNGHEVCDCFRKPSGKSCCKLATENRLYSKGNTVIGFFQWFGQVLTSSLVLIIT